MVTHSSRMHDTCSVPLSAHPDLDVDVVTLLDNNLTGALTAVQSGAIDVSFRAVTVPAEDRPDGESAAHAIAVIAQQITLRRLDGRR
jgi:hypothetical protein